MTGLHATKRGSLPPPDDLEAARRLVLAGQDAAAKRAYLAVLGRDAANFCALNELAALAGASGHRSAARTALRQAVACHPDNPVGRVNLGNLLAEEGELDEARAHFEAALAADPDCAPAHQGLARVLTELGDAQEAAPHWHRGFTGHAVVAHGIPRSIRGVPVLLLVSARGGDIPTKPLLDDRVFAVTALHAEYHDPAQPLPPHTLVFNAIGEADACGAALAQAGVIAARSCAPMINPPARVRGTGRAEVAQRLAGLPDVIVPEIRILPGTALHDLDASAFPLLLRVPGFHTGRHFVRVACRADLPAAIAALPGDRFLAIEYLDARGSDGMARKYRVMMIDGRPYPLHLAISADRKVHYFTADMAADPARRSEEQRFLEDMDAVLGARAVAALARIARRLGLEWRHRFRPRQRRFGAALRGQCDHGDQSARRRSDVGLPARAGRAGAGGGAADAAGALLGYLHPPIVRGCCRSSHGGF